MSRHYLIALAGGASFAGVMAGAMALPPAPSPVPFRPRE